MKKLFSFILLATVLFFVKPASVKAQSCDTLFNLTSVTDTPFLYFTGSYGYLSGNNSYSDAAKAEGFSGNFTGAYLNSAVLYFGFLTINPTDSNMPVTVAAWDNKGTSIAGVAGAPGNMIDSTQITLGQIAAALDYSSASGYITGVVANFLGGAALTTDTIYVGVVLPTVTGDTVALLTNTFSGTNGNGWEFESNYIDTASHAFVWGTYDFDYTDTGATSLGNYIIANICGTPDTTVLNTSFTASDTSGCVPDTVNFTDMTSPYANSWFWSFGDGNTSLAATPSDIYTSAGTYTVEEISYNLISGVFPGFALEFYNPATINITVKASPSASNSITPATGASAANGSAIVTASGGTPPYSFVWTGNSSTSDSIKNVLPGNYSVTITGHNGCVYVDAVDITYTTGIVELGGGRQLKIYPNPATDVLNLVWSQESNDEVTIIDMNGKVLTTYESIGATNNVYDVHNLQAGTYVIRITDRSSNAQKAVLFTKL